MRYNKAQSLGDILRQQLSSVVGDTAMTGLDEIKVIDTWHETLGEYMCRYTCNERFEKGRLTVTVKSSVLRNDLFMQRTTLLRLLNEKLGEQKVKFLELM